jgi:hypothetical protein
MRLQGSESGGELRLEEFTNSRLSAYIKLIPENSLEVFKWEGLMNNTPPDNREFTISIARQR